MFGTNNKKKEVHSGTRTRSLSLRRRAPYPLGHTDMTYIWIDKDLPIPASGTMPNKSLWTTNMYVYMMCMMDLDKGQLLAENVP